MLEPSIVATLMVTPEGKPVTVAWGEWGPTCELRFTVKPYTSTLAPRLQQLWSRYGYNSIGAMTEVDKEWRDVPTVIAD